MVQDEHGEILYTTADVARVEDVTPATVRAWERTGKLPALRTISGQRIFRGADVEAMRAIRRAAREAKAAR